MNAKQPTTIQVAQATPVYSALPVSSVASGVQLQQAPVAQPVGVATTAPPDAASWARAEAPVLCDLADTSSGGGTPFQMQRLKVKVEVHIASMFVSMEGIWTAQPRSGRS